MISNADDTRRDLLIHCLDGWTLVARRPGKTYSYTNNWPPEELVGNTLTGDAIMSSAACSWSRCWEEAAWSWACTADIGLVGGMSRRSVRCGSCLRPPSR